MQTEHKKVACPNCKRTISHYLSGTDSVYRNICPKCKSTVIVYSAGKTALLTTELSIEIKINF